MAVTAVPADARQSEQSEPGAVFLGPDNADYYAPAEQKHTFRGMTLDLLNDQKAIWTSPFHLRYPDAQWLVPFLGVTTGFLITDREVSAHISQDPTRVQHYRTLANAGVAGFAGVAGGLFMLGVVHHDEHAKEAGWLSGEAGVNSVIVAEGLKYIFGRERPNVGDGSGKFFKGGSSFPSTHAIAAWSVAGILTHEYPGTLTKILSYGLATAVSFSRVQSRDHFPSDVLVSSALGWMVAQQVYRKRHNPELPGGEWRSIGEMVRSDADAPWKNPGTPFVPLDSWIYPALERLAALGYIQLQFLGMRPWTRLECQRAVLEAEQKLNERGPVLDGSRQLVRALEKEFSTESEILAGDLGSFVRLDSLYTRSTLITGRPLTDAFHFGETITNDFGRPYQQGFNNATGFSLDAHSGRFTAYVRAEYQHAPAGPAYTPAMLQAIAAADMNPVQSAVLQPEVNRLDLLEGYIGTNLNNWQVTIGKQNLWWGPEAGGPLLFSDNAEAIPMVRVSQLAPVQLPWIFRYLGAFRVDFFFGQLAGHEFPGGTIAMHGEKISLKPTPNLELGFSRTSIFGGEGRPLTLGAFVNSYIGYTSSVNFSASSNPGKRTGAFEFSYRLPFVRNWLSIYADSVTPDDPSPIDAPRRAAVNTGLYASHIPGIPRLDLRFEGGYTDTSTSRSIGGKYIYWEQFYHDLYTNDHGLMGSWIGREGQGFRSSSRYWFSAKNNIQFEFRRLRVDQDFMPGGGSLTDFAVGGDCWVRGDFALSARVQYERWLFPVIQPGASHNFTTMLELHYEPERLLGHRRGSTSEEATR